MKKIALLLFLTPCRLLAWNGSDHQAMTRLALEKVAAPWGLNQPVAVHPLKSLLAKISTGGERMDPWHFSDWLKINPAIDLEKPAPELDGKKTLTPLEILSAYCIDPDDGRDQDLFVRDAKGRPRYAYPDQQWFGSISGPHSQAFRHIEKPPFSFRHPLATFGFPFRSVGEATRRAQIWFLLSELAFSKGEDYWGWRFLANALHYLEDLHNPYHAGQITPTMMAKGLWLYLLRGYGFLNTFANLVADSHLFFEDYVENPAGHDEGMKKTALWLLSGTSTTAVDDLQTLAVQIRDRSNLYFPALVKQVSRVQNPNDKHFAEANRKIFSIVGDRFASAGEVIRTAVKASLEKRGSKTAAAWLEQLNQLL